MLRGTKQSRNMTESNLIQQTLYQSYLKKQSYFSMLCHPVKPKVIQDIFKRQVLF